MLTHIAGQVHTNQEEMVGGRRCWYSLKFVQHDQVSETTSFRFPQFRGCKVQFVSHHQSPSRRVESRLYLSGHRLSWERRSLTRDKRKFQHIPNFQEVRHATASPCGTAPPLHRARAMFVGRPMLCSRICTSAYHPQQSHIGLDISLF